MSRNRYDEAFGVLPLRWESGAPSDGTYGLVLVEVWHAEAVLGWTQDTKPLVRVQARREVRVYVGGVWQAVDSAGRLCQPLAGSVRRHARLAAARTWRHTINLDGWGAQ